MCGSGSRINVLLLDVTEAWGHSLQVFKCRSSAPFRGGCCKARALEGSTIFKQRVRPGKLRVLVEERQGLGLT